MELVAHQVTVAYPGATSPAVHGVTLRAQPGRVTAVVGPNGCGKSTLLKAMARLLPLRAGAVTVEGLDVHRASSRVVAQRVAVMPQHVVAPAAVTVREAVERGRFPHRRWGRGLTAADRQAVAQAMQLTDIGELADRPVAELSGGQQQRVWLAMAWAQECPVMMLDEPTAALDLGHAVQLMALLRDAAHQQRRTVVVVVHDLSLAAAVADDVVVMQRGRVVAEGCPEHVLTAERVEAVFGVGATVLRHPLSLRPVIAPILPGVGGGSGFRVPTVVTSCA